MHRYRSVGSQRSSGFAVQTMMLVLSMVGTTSLFAVGLYEAYQKWWVEPHKPTELSMLRGERDQLKKRNSELEEAARELREQLQDEELLHAAEVIAGPIPDPEETKNILVSPEEDSVLGISEDIKLDRLERASEIVRNAIDRRDPRLASSSRKSIGEWKRELPLYQKRFENESAEMLKRLGIQPEHKSLKDLMKEVAERASEDAKDSK